MSGLASACISAWRAAHHVVRQQHLGLRRAGLEEDLGHVPVHDLGHLLGGQVRDRRVVVVRVLPGARGERRAAEHIDARDGSRGGGIRAAGRVHTDQLMQACCTGDAGKHGNAP